MFRDRLDAGRRLASRLLDWRGRDAIVVALPRGGVPIGAEIAKAIQAPLDLVLVRKIGLPFQPELAVAAVVDGDEPELVLNQDIVGSITLPDGYIDGARKEALSEIERRRALYPGERKTADVSGRPVIIADDGIATGSTVRAAIHALRRKQPSHLILAVPVAPADTVDRLRPEVDDLICLETPDPFYAISLAYEAFPQLTDEQVINILAASPQPEKPSDRAGARTDPGQDDQAA